MSDYLKKIVAQCVPGISLDCVVFGYQGRVLKVLLLKYKDHHAWALPGGFLPKDQEMQEAVGHILKERTGLEGVYLEQFHTYSSTNRGWKSNEVGRTGFEKLKNSWEASDRVIQIGRASCRERV